MQHRLVFKPLIGRSKWGIATTAGTEVNMRLLICGHRCCFSLCAILHFFSDILDSECTSKGKCQMNVS